MMPRRRLGKYQIAATEFRANEVGVRAKIAIFQLAGAEGIEPSLLVLETSVLPLNYAPNFPEENYSESLLKDNMGFFV